MTGYTYYIENGKIKTGKDFLLLCSRASCVAWHLRDEPLSVPTPKEFYPDPHYQEAITEAAKQVERWENITLEEATKLYKQNWEEDLRELNAQLQKYTETNSKLNKIYEEIKSWTPPSTEHESIKKFALKQIEDSFCSEDNLLDLIESTKEKIRSMDNKSAIKNFLLTRQQIAREDYRYITDHYEKELESSKRKTEFMKQLIESLEQLPNE